eukprot:5927972-Amphidinium_carterae.1
MTRRIATAYAQLSAPKAESRPAIVVNGQVSRVRQAVRKEHNLNKTTPQSGAAAPKDANHANPTHTCYVCTNSARVDTYS